MPARHPPLLLGLLSLLTACPAAPDDSTSSTSSTAAAAGSGSGGGSSTAGLTPTTSAASTTSSTGDSSTGEPALPPLPPLADPVPLTSDTLRVPRHARDPEKLRDPRIPADLAGYVLDPFPEDEVPLVQEAVGAAAEAAECLLREGAAAAMNRFNGRRP